MTLSIHDAVALLREARGGFSSIDEVAVEHECDCPPEWPRCGLCRIRQMASRLERRIDTAIAQYEADMEQHRKDFARDVKDLDRHLAAARGDKS
jgi:hypothetical protein